MQAPPPIRFAEDEVSPPPQVYSPSGATDGLYPEVVKPPPEHRQYPEVLPTPVTPLKRNASQWNCFGLQRKRFILLICAIIFVVAGAIVGGVVGGVVGSQQKGTKSSSSPEATSTSVGDNSEDDDASSASTTSPTAWTSTTVTASDSSSTDSVGIAAAISFPDGDIPSIQVLYQTDSSSSLKYRIYVDPDGYGTEKTLRLSQPAEESMPMSITSTTDSDGNTIMNLFYICNSDIETEIVWAIVTCVKGKKTCSETSSDIIATNPDADIHPESKIAAVWLGKAVDGSSIALTLASGPVINVFFVGSDSERPEVITYDQDQGWLDGVEIDDSSIPGWTPTVQLAACYEPTPDLYRLYYTKEVSGQIMEWWRYRSDEKWLAPGASPEWLPADSGLAALCWEDQGRLLYFGKEILKESVLSNGSWVGTNDI
ncbi:Fc.00g044900.m01.CDS01 [Cosmosporella sp. VM-42]